MASRFRIYRASNTIKDIDAEHLELMRTAILRGKQILKDYPPVDTFAGRKTKEPFPSEEESVIAGECAPPPAR